MRTQRVRDVVGRDTDATDYPRLRARPTPNAVPMAAPRATPSAVWLVATPIAVPIPIPTAIQAPILTSHLLDRAESAICA